MKFAAFTIAYNEESLIQGAINTWKGHVDKHLVMVSIKPFYGKAEPPDATVKICEQNGVEVYQGWWEREQDMRNAAIRRLSSYDYIFVNDADMWITPDDMVKLKEEVVSKEALAYIIPQVSYWRDTDHIIVGDDFKPVIAVHPATRFVHIGNVNSACAVIESAKCHHLNWCAPKDILKKVKTYSHAPELEDVDKWYNEHWLPWSGGKAIMPRSNSGRTKEFGKAFDTIVSPLPAELKKWLD